MLVLEGFSEIYCSDFSEHFGVLLQWKFLFINNRTDKILFGHFNAFDFLWYISPFKDKYIGFFVSSFRYTKNRKRKILTWHKRETLRW